MDIKNYNYVFKKKFAEIKKLGDSLLTSLNNFYSYYFHRGKPIPSGYAILAVTYLCNSRCVMCNIWQQYRKNSVDLKKEMPCEDFLRIVKDSKILKKINEISITGGEPFLKKDFVNLLTGLFTIENIYKIYINTNGLCPSRIYSVTEAVVSKIKKGQHLKIFISIDGEKEDNNQIRGGSGFHDRAIKSLNSLRKIEKLHPDLFSVSVATVIQPMNIDRIDKYEQIMKKSGVKIDYMMIQESFYTKTIGAAYSAKAFSSGQIKKVIQKIKEMKLLGMEKWLKCKEKRPLPCFAGFSAFIIDPYGNLYPCCTRVNDEEFIMGNVLENDFDTLWVSERAWKIREKVKACRFNYCWTGCEINQSRVQFDPLEKLSNLLTLKKTSLYHILGLK